MALRIALVLATLSWAACSDDIGQCPCKGYVECAYKTGTAPGSLDSSYGANGSCWQTLNSSDSCCAFCRQAAMTYETSGVAADAGCTIPWPHEPTD
jgi:hypothetical protein